MTAGLPENNTPSDPSEADDTSPASLDADAAPTDGREPDTAGPADATDPDVDPVPATGPDAAARTVLDGPALENEEMRRGTQTLRSSEVKPAQAREFADEVARQADPAPPARPGDES